MNESPYEEMLDGVGQMTKDDARALAIAFTAVMAEASEDYEVAWKAMCKALSRCGLDFTKASDRLQKTALRLNNTEDWKMAAAIMGDTLTAKLARNAMGFSHGFTQEHYDTIAGVWDCTAILYANARPFQHEAYQRWKDSSLNCSPLGEEPPSGDEKG